MFLRHIHPADVPLFSNDLEVCQQVFDVGRSEFAVAPGSGASDLIAAGIIHAYKQSVREPAQLILLARAAYDIRRNLQKEDGTAASEE